MGIPTYRTTTIRSLIANTKLECRIDDTTAEDIYIERYVRICAKAMNTALDYAELTASLEIDNFQAILPCEFVRFDRYPPIVFTTNGVVDSGAYYSNWNLTYTGGPFLTCSPINPERNQWGLPTVQVQDGRLHFSNNISATECTISYLAVRTDANGEMVIPELNSRAIVAGATTMYKNSIGQADALNAGFWTRGVQDARGSANIPDSLEQQRLEIIWNTL